MTFFPYFFFSGKTSLMIAASLGNLGAMHAMLLHPLYTPHPPPAGLTDLVAAGEFREFSLSNSLEAAASETTLPMRP
jgi:hypothetical protein